MTDRVRSEQENVGEHRAGNEQAHDAVDPAVRDRSAPSASRDQTIVAPGAIAGTGLTDRERNERWPLG